MTSIKRAVWMVLGIIAGTMVAGAARADTVVYNQPAQFPGGFTAWTSSYDPSTFGNIYQTYDNFSLSAPASITGVTWQGFSFDATTSKATSTPVTAFNIDVYADNGGAPGTLLYQSTESSFTKSSAGTVDFFNKGSSETVYNYAATLATPFAATSNTTYWLMIQGVTDYPAYWTWNSGTGGDGLSYQTSSVFSIATSRAGDRTFSLIAAPLPNPILAGGVLLGAVGVARLSAVRRAAEAS